MRPEEFGPFLAEQRKKQNMTQTELAQRLHVSTAAVSKWERGKCLPELGKLEDIAQVLGISVLEVMKCQISEKPVTAETVTETYCETAKLSASQHRQKTVRWAAALVAVLVLTAAAGVCIHFFPLYRIVRVWSPSYFETGEISDLAYIGSREDRQTAQAVLDKAEAAFSDLTTPRDQKAEAYGLLARYATEAELNAAAETHSLELWSAHFELVSGRMWVFYSQECYDEEGTILSGSWNIPSLWYLEKNASGEWEIVGIKEHP